MSRELAEAAYSQLLAADNTEGADRMTRPAEPTAHMLAGDDWPWTPMVVTGTHDIYLARRHALQLLTRADPDGCRVDRRYYDPGRAQTGHGQWIRCLPDTDAGSEGYDEGYDWEWRPGGPPGRDTVPYVSWDQP